MRGQENYINLFLLIFLLSYISCKAVKVKEHFIELDQPYELEAMKSGHNYKLRKGTYRLTRVINLLNKRDISIDGQGSVFIMDREAPLSNGYGLLNLRDCKNISIKNIILDANSIHRGCKESYAHTLILLASEGIILHKITCKNNTADGIFIGAGNPLDTATYSKHIQMTNMLVKGSCRNGLSIINGYDIQVLDSEFSDSRGLKPESGIDVEADLDKPIPSNRNILIAGCTFRNNGEWGIMTSQKGTPTAIVLKNNQIEDCRNGIFIASVDTKVTGNVILNSVDYGILSTRYDGCPVDENVIDSNVIKNGKHGIFYIGEKGIIQNNRIINMNEAAIWLSGNTTNYTSAIIRDNQITGPSKYGICSNNFQSVTIKGNALDGKSPTGLYMTNGEQVVSGNMINGAMVGIESVGSRTKIQDNSFEDCGTGIRIINGGRYNPEGTILMNKFIRTRSTWEGQTPNFRIGENEVR
ncbi:MAG: right-handed parallel beta-helix repeat-containing protein [Saprospiraceae bacterium]|nr:right-handed parallel beta-helix repeat-containing protein [Saprospiraceae bacterium]